MTCKPFINAISTNNQTLLANGLVEFNATNVNTGCGIDFVSGSNTLTVTRQGYYRVSFDADLNPAASGLIGVQILNNNNVIPCAEATFTATADTVEHVHVQGAFRVLSSCKCVTNNATLQVQITNGSAIVGNASVIVEAVKL